MSTSAPIPPDDQPTRVTPQAGAPGPGAQPPAGGSGGKTYSAGVLAAIAVAVLVVAGLGGYFIGHSSGDDSGQKSGYDKGFTAGQEQVHAQYRPGQQAYETIYEKGKADGVAEGTRQGQAEGQRTGEAQGQRVGFEQGQRQGVTTGEADGVRQGAAAVLGGFSTWDDGAFYIITMRPSETEGVGYEITSRTQLQPDTDYKLCDDGGSQQVCQSAATAATGGSTADDGGATGNE
jgi:hypothetical protein